MTTQQRPIITSLSQQLGLDEGSSKWVYTDNRPQKYNTIGKGRLCDSRIPSSGLSDVEIEYLFQGDLSRTLKEAQDHIPWINELDTVRKDAILNMCFQMGAAGVAGFPKALAALRQKNYPICASELRASAWNSQTHERSERIIKQILTGAYQ